MRWLDLASMLWCCCAAAAVAAAASASAPPFVPVCRDPDLGGRPLLSLSRNQPGAGNGTLVAERQKYMLVGGAGAGIGNFLVFFPAAYYFAVFGGRDVLVIDDSLIGELCSVLHCGFPKYQSVAAAYPGVLTAEAFRTMGHAKAYDFHRFVGGMVTYDQTLVQADGYKYMSGWYMDRAHTEACAAVVSGCHGRDVGCHDRHALQRLVRGPFAPARVASEEARIIGVPRNLKHAVLALPHSYAPRLDAAVHLRCQFRHFEQLVGPDDGARWLEAQREIEAWINSTEPSKGRQLFKVITDKMLEQFTAVQAKAAAERRRRLLGVARVLEHFAPALAPTLAPDGDGQGRLRRRRLQSARDGEVEARRRLQDGAASVSDGAIRRYLRGDGRATRRLATADADAAPASEAEEAGDAAADADADADVASEVEVEVASVRHVLRYLTSTVALPALRRALALALVAPDPHTRRRLDGDAAATTTPAADSNATAGRGASTAPAAPAAATATTPAAAAAVVDVLEEEVYKGAEAGRVYVYIASDNEVVKEAFARYLSALSQPNAALRFAPMRVKNKAHIVHAKNTGYLKGNGNSTGVMDLVLDWYALSLANFVFAWRRDTDMLSTFAQSAQRMTGHSEVPQRTAAAATAAAAAAVPAASGNGSDATTPPTAAAQYPHFLPLQPNANGYGGGAVLHGQGSRGFQLVPSRKYGLAWREF